MESNEQFYIRFNLAGLIGFHTAHLKIISRNIEYLLDNPDVYHFNKLSRKEIIYEIEHVKEAYRVSEHIFHERSEKDYDFGNISEIKNLIRNQNPKDENGRTNKLDA